MKNLKRWSVVFATFFVFSILGANFEAFAKSGGGSGGGGGGGRSSSSGSFGNSGGGGRSVSAQSNSGGFGNSGKISAPSAPSSSGGTGFFGNSGKAPAAPAAPSSSGGTGFFGNSGKAPAAPAAPSSSGGTGFFGNSGKADTPKATTNSNSWFGNSGKADAPKAVTGTTGIGNSGKAAAVATGFGNSGSPQKLDSGTSKGSAPPKTAMQQKMDKTYSKGESVKAQENFKAEQSKFKTNPEATANYKPSAQQQTTINVIQRNVVYTNPTDYYNRRNTFYGSYGWSPPMYSYNSYNRFGMWDAAMLWFMLDHLHDRQYSDMYYHHRNDPGMQQFRTELNRLSADNAELRAKVASLDSKTHELEAQGVKADPTYVPADAADVVLAADVAQKEIPVKKSGGFPWFWTFVVLSIIGGTIWYVRRRR